jgi:hypothetical protein
LGTPMRIASTPDDRSYSPHFHLVTVFLEGAERNNVELADEEQRYAVQLARDEWGRPVLDKEGRQVRQKFYGAVRIDAPAWLRISQESPDYEEEGLGAVGAALYAMAMTP